MRVLVIMKEFLSRPFGSNIAFFVAMLLLSSSPDLFFWTIHGNAVFGVYMFLHGLIMCYLIVLILGLFKGSMFKIFLGVSLFLGVVNLIADTMAHDVMHFGFTGDIVAIILGSNVAEVSEFLPMYINWRVICFIVTVLILVSVILTFRKSWNKYVNKWMTYALFCLMCLSVCVVTVRKSKNWESVFLCKIGLFLSYDTPIDMKPFRTMPEVDILGNQPDCIVMVIGESLSKSHCSLYGYSKKTTPMQDKMKSDSLLLVFNNIVPPYTNTVGVFKSLMSTYRNEYNVDNWYEYLFLMDAMKSSGYKSYWISNQSSTGIYDNIIAKFAELSDSLIWVGTKGKGIGKTDLDEDVLPVIDSVLENEGEKLFVIVHLMGSHEGFSTRYPSEFALFTSNVYLDYPKNQREMIAAYDNSIFYNDYVLVSIMRLFDNKEAVVFCFPDHSLDVYDSDPTYVGHARTSDPASVEAGMNIPFVVYQTELYKKNFIDNSTRLNNATDKVFCTEDMIYTLLDIANVKLSGSDDVERFSLLGKD